MKRIKARDCMSENFEKVAEDSCPSHYPEGDIFAVFNNFSEAGVFRGLVTKNDIGSHDTKTFGSIVSQKVLGDVQADAEGVETKEQLFILQDLGCDIIQGYCFSRALPPESIDLILKQGF